MKIEPYIISSVVAECRIPEVAGGLELFDSYLTRHLTLVDVT